jgi:hypothetical protein
MLILYCGTFNVTFPPSSFFFWSRPVGDSTPSAVITDAIYRHVIDDRLVIYVHVCDVHIVYGAVVGEATMIPIAAFIAMADVSETIVHSTIEADVRAPIAGMP